MVDEGRGECRAGHVFLVSSAFRIQVCRPDAHSKRGGLAVWQGHDGLLRVRPELRSQPCHSEQWFLGETSFSFSELSFSSVNGEDDAFHSCCWD